MCGCKEGESKLYLKKIERVTNRTDSILSSVFEWLPEKAQTMRLLAEIKGEVLAFEGKTETCIKLMEKLNYHFIQSKIESNDY